MSNECKLTECQGKPRCGTCLVMDHSYVTPQAAGALPVGDRVIMHGSARVGHLS